MIGERLVWRRPRETIKDSKKDSNHSPRSRLRPVSGWRIAIDHPCSWRAALQQTPCCPIQHCPLPCCRSEAHCAPPSCPAPRQPTHKPCCAIHTQSASASRCKPSSSQTFSKTPCPNAKISRQRSPHRTDVKSRLPTSSSRSAPTAILAPIPSQGSVGAHHYQLVKSKRPRSSQLQTTNPDATARCDRLDGFFGFRC
jgi:hypothetical protein